MYSSLSYLHTIYDLAYEKTPPSYSSGVIPLNCSVSMRPTPVHCPRRQMFQMSLQSVQKWQKCSLHSAVHAVHDRQCRHDDKYDRERKKGKTVETEQERERAKSSRVRPNTTTNSPNASDVISRI